jgi:hypothetical protein
MRRRGPPPYGQRRCTARAPLPQRLRCGLAASADAFDAAAVVAAASAPSWAATKAASAATRPRRATASVRSATRHSSRASAVEGVAGSLPSKLMRSLHLHGAPQRPTTVDPATCVASKPKHSLIETWYRRVAQRLWGASCSAGARSADRRLRRRDARWHRRTPRGVARLARPAPPRVSHSGPRQARVRRHASRRVRPQRLGRATWISQLTLPIWGQECYEGSVTLPRPCGVCNVGLMRRA